MKEVNERVRYRRELVNFLLFDYEGVQAHLEKMAAKGWILDTIGQNVWKYRKAEPAKLKYAVTYAPDASIFDPEPTENQQTLADFCARAGWVKVGDWSQAQIFVNENENPVPIETDEEIRLDVIRESMHKSWIPANVILVLLVLFNTWRSTAQFLSNPIEYLTNYWMLMTQVFSVVALVLVSSNLIGYFVWTKKSGRQVEAGGSCCSPRIVRQLNKWSLIAALTYFGLVILATMSAGESFAVKYMVAYMIGFVGLVSLLNFTRSALKKRGVSKGANMAVFIIVDIIFAFAMVSAVMAFAMSDIFSADVREKDPYEPEVHSTFVAASISGKVAEPEFRYETSHIKSDVLFDWCFEKTLERERDRFMGQRIIEEDPHTEIWGADKLYGCRWSVNDPVDSWILVKENYIVKLWLYEELTDTEKGQVLEKAGVTWKE